MKTGRKTKMRKMSRRTRRMKTSRKTRMDRRIFSLLPIIKMTSTATATAKLRPLRSLHALAAEEEARISALTQPSATSICETNRKSSDTPNLPL
ncbi:hypothetical protein IWX92DRAFT_444360, partial [Phyllosticta citricarpa]